MPFLNMRSSNCLGPDEEIDTLLKSCREMAQKSNLLYNRWLRAKGLSLWVNQSDHEQAFELLTEAESLAPNNPGEALWQSGC